MALNIAVVHYSTTGHVQLLVECAEKEGPPGDAALSAAHAQWRRPTRVDDALTALQVTA